MFFGFCVFSNFLLEEIKTFDARFGTNFSANVAITTIMFLSVMDFMIFHRSVVYSKHCSWKISGTIL